MNIPLFKVHMPRTVIEPLKATLESGVIAQGDKVVQFERWLGERLGTPRVLALSDCSAAMTLALCLAGVRPGDEVIVSPMICVASTMPIANLFARPAWCDVDPLTGMPRPEHVEEAISARTRALIIYHWSGDPADLAPVHALAKARGIKLIADASEAFGASYRGEPLGRSWCDFTVYSFGPVRHVTTGEGGALVSADEGDHERGKWLRKYGIHQPSFRLGNGDLNPESDIPVAGYFFPMNNIAATIGLEQAGHADRIVARHGENGRFYDDALARVPGLTLLARDAKSRSAYWTYSLRAERRAELQRKLHEGDIGSQRLHLRNDRYGCFAASGRGEFGGVTLFDRENLAIPCGWWVSDEDRERVASAIRSGW